MGPRFRLCYVPVQGTPLFRTMARSQHTVVQCRRSTSIGIIRILSLRMPRALRMYTMFFAQGELRQFGRLFISIGNTTFLGRSPLGPTSPGSLTSLSVVCYVLGGSPLVLTMRFSVDGAVISMRGDRDFASGVVLGTSRRQSMLVCLFFSLMMG